MKVLIQGAGITGLALARELMARGVDFLIVERASEVKPVGAGITLGANALGCLARTLPLERLRERGESIRELAITDQRGRVLMSTPSQVEGVLRTGIAIHRHQLHECLLEGIPSAKIRLGTCVEAFHLSETSVEAKLSDGSEERFEFLVGADGLRSRIRSMLFPDHSIRFSGYACWRAVVDRSLRDPGHAIEMWGPGRRLGLVPIGNGRTYVYATLNVSASQYSARATDRSVREVIALFDRFAGDAREFLDAMARLPGLIHNDLEEVELPQWHSGRVLLIGDAAHAMTPNLGQGAAMGIEDAAVLARIWESDSNPKSLEDFEKIRRPRVRWIQNKSRELGKLAQSENPGFIWLRNQALRLIPGAIIRRNLRQVLASV